ncbi:MAG: glycosyltransferase 87 family protein [Actinomycetota bacterium]
MGYVVTTSVIVVLGLVFIFVAERFNWSPPLWVSILIAITTRAIVIAVIQGHWPQPTDFADQFPAAGMLVLKHGNPMQWIPFLPLMSYLFAGELWVTLHTGLPWTISGRIVPAFSDVFIVLLVSRLAPSKGRLRAFQYALNPVSLLICTVHGQMDPIVLVFGVSAFIAARRERSGLAGFLVGIAIAARTWPLLLMPGLLITLRKNSQRLKALVASIVPAILLLVTMPIMVSTSMSEAIHRVASYRSSMAGDWGWTGIGEEVLGAGRWESHQGSWLALGAKLLLLAVVVAILLWRHADGVDMTIAILFAFLMVTAGLGNQYLIWAAPFLAVRPTRGTGTYLLTASAWAAFGYIVLQGFQATPTWPRLHSVSIGLSIGVIITVIAAMPWERRKREAPQALAIDQEDLASFERGLNV